MSEIMRESTRKEFQELLNETIFEGKHTKKTISRLRELYDPKKGQISNYDLILFNIIDFSKQDKFIEQIKMIISDFNKVKQIIISKVDKSATTEFISAAKNIASYYDDLNYFINNMVNGLKKLPSKIECDSIFWGYPKDSLDKLKENVINLESKLAPLVTSLSAELSDFNENLTALDKDKPVDVITGLVNFMTDHKYDQITGSSLSPLNRVDGYVKCGTALLMVTTPLS